MSRSSSPDWPGHKCEIPKITKSRSAGAWLKWWCDCLSSVRLRVQTPILVNPTKINFLDMKISFCMA
jgi:hypothetical protein